MEKPRASFVILIVGVVVALAAVIWWQNSDGGDRTAPPVAQNVSEENEKEPTPRRRPVLTRTSTQELPNEANPSVSVPDRDQTSAEAPRVRRSRLKRDLPQDATQLEVAYRNEQEEVGKFEIIDTLADMGTLQAVQTMDRLFQAESDLEMKIEILDSLQLIDEHHSYKMRIFSNALLASQPFEVRLAAIDGLLELDDPGVIPVLRGLLNDPNPEIRESARDAIDFIEG